MKACYFLRLEYCCIKSHLKRLYLIIIFINTNLGVVTSFRNGVGLPQIATTTDGFTGVTLRVWIFLIVY